MTDFTANALNKGWFTEPGSYVQFGGSWGSEGKGLTSSFMAQHFGAYVDAVVTNNAPNSGHVFYLPNGDKMTLCQLPTFSACQHYHGIKTVAYLNAGSAVDVETLKAEMDMLPGMSVVVHPHAAIILPEHKEQDAKHIASTSKGVGPAFQAKLGRRIDAVVAGHMDRMPAGVFVDKLDLRENTVYGECPQGFGLGINAGFYPTTTSRNCVPMQLMADSLLSHRNLTKTLAVVRSHPIRVGNIPEGSSGGCYVDQREISFEDIGQETELTTVTKRPRRIFTWSNNQFITMLKATDPDALHIGFMDYVSDPEGFVRRLVNHYIQTLHREPDFVTGGFGPRNENVKWMF